MFKSKEGLLNHKFQSATRNSKEGVGEGKGLYKRGKGTLTFPLTSKQQRGEEGGIKKIEKKKKKKTTKHCYYETRIVYKTIDRGVRGSLTPISVVTSSLSKTSLYKN